MLIGLLTDGTEVDLVGDELTLSGPEASLTLIDQETADPDRPLIGTLWEGSVILFGSGASSNSSLVPSPDEVPVDLDADEVDEFIKSAIGPVVKAMNVDDAVTLLQRAGWIVTVDIKPTTTAPVPRHAIVLSECDGIVVDVGRAN